MAIDAGALKELQQIHHRGMLRVLVFAAIHLGACATVLSLVERGTPWWALIPLYLVAAASLHGISLFTHEGVHGALARWPLVNRLLAALFAWPVWQNFAAYKVLHLRHHADLGGPRDPDHYPNYMRWTPGTWMMFWGRLLVGYPVYITAIPVLGFWHGTWRDRAWIVFELGMVIALSAGAIALLPSSWLVHGWLIPMVFINTMVNIRGMSQHTLLPESAHPVHGSRTILANPVTRFFMCNENFHLEHHLHPRVPWYNLPRVHALLHDELVQQQAPFIPSYASFVGEFVAASWRRVRRSG